MTRTNELMLSDLDAGVLADAVLTHRADAEASDEILEILEEARRVPHESFPVDVVGMNCRVTYEERPAGTRRTVAIVNPRSANPAEGRISVLSPIGRRLLGRTKGSLVGISVPGGKVSAIRVLAIERAS